MKNCQRLFSWVAFGAIGRDGVDRLGESECAEIMQKAWGNSLYTIATALEGGQNFASQHRRRFAENFAKKFIVPFAVKNRLTSPNLEGFLAKALQQCRKIIKKKAKVMDFQHCGKLPFREAPENFRDAEEMGLFVVNKIQTDLGSNAEFPKLLRHRNLVLQGMVSHFAHIASGDFADKGTTGKLQRDYRDLFSVIFLPTPEPEECLADEPPKNGNWVQDWEME